MICIGCKIFFEPRLDLGHRYVFIHIEGDFDMQREAVTIITARMQSWQESQAIVAAAAATASTTTGVNSSGGVNGTINTSRSTSTAGSGGGGLGTSLVSPHGIPAANSFDSTGTNNEASTSLHTTASVADVAIGVSLAISAEIAFIFEAELDPTVMYSSTSSLVHDLIVRHEIIYKELCTLCEQKNVMFQLLPPSVALSRKFDLRKLAIIAPTTAVLVDFMAVLFKYVANLTHEGTLCFY